MMETTKKTWVKPEIYIEEINETNNPMKDPGTDEGAFEQMS
jgi:hypothetical protein